MRVSECIYEGLKPFIPSMEIVKATSRSVSCGDTDIYIRYEFGGVRLNHVYIITWRLGKFQVNDSKVFCNGPELGC